SGFMTENGSKADLLKSYGLQEGEPGKGIGKTYKNAYSANIRNTDATVLVGRILNRNDSADRDLFEIINRYNQPHLVIPKEEVLSHPEAVGEKIAQFASEHNVQSLNIIGERETQAPGLQKAMREAINKTLELNSQVETKVDSQIEVPIEVPSVAPGINQPKVNQQNSKDVSASKQQTLINEPAAVTVHKDITAQNVGTTISAYSKDGLGAALSPETKLAAELGNLQNNYPVSYNDNKEFPPGTYGGETYPEVKPKGKPFISANQAYQAYSQPSEQAEQKMARMTEILKAKLSQHLRLVEGITKRGGVTYLENSTHISCYKDKFWDGKGKESRFIQALSAAYTATIEKEVSTKQLDGTARSLQKWAEVAKFLNRDYVETIHKIQKIYSETKQPLTQNQQQTMQRDSKDAEITKEVKNLANRLANTLVEDIKEDGLKTVRGQKYTIESNERNNFTRIIDTNTADILLSVENNQVQVNKLNHDVYQSLKSAVELIDEKVKSAQMQTDYNQSKSANLVNNKTEISK
ncbi:MAG: putative molybdenum carrier protein, partial [Cyanobacteria bacterium J06639_18]